jgi:hypothetical protein
MQVWVDAAVTEDVFMGMSNALVKLSPASFSVQHMLTCADVC